LKVITAVALAVIALAAMGVARLRDASRRPDYCVTCHFMEPYVQTWMSSDYLAFNHAEFGVSCQRCHERGVKDLLREVAKTIKHDYELPFRPIDFPAEVCQRCHGDYARLARRSESLPRNPHASPHELLECNTCHKAHQASQDACAGCHEPMVTKPGWTAPQ